MKVVPRMFDGCVWLFELSYEICFKNQEVSKILVVLLECVEISHYAKFIKG